MINNPEILAAIHEGWQNYQQLIIDSLRPLNQAQLEFRPSPHHRSVGEIAQHIAAARAYWFSRLMGEGGKEFQALAKWDGEGEKLRSCEELIAAIMRTWEIMHLTIANWSPADWQQTWPGRGRAPKIITRQWVIWHLMEHDLHHGGEISVMLGMNGLQGFDM